MYKLLYVLISLALTNNSMSSHPNILTGNIERVTPRTPTEQMMYTTIRIETNTGSVGTGFIYNFNLRTMEMSCLVTSKHVIKGSTQGKIVFHLADATGKKMDYWEEHVLLI